MTAKETTFDYVDSSGNFLFQVVRSQSKEFRQRQKAADGTWIWTLNGLSEEQRFVLYRLPDVSKSLAVGNPVYLCEGEKDCETLQSIGFVATCNACGAGRMKSQHVEIFKKHENTRAVIFADNDEPGRKHAQQTAELLWAARCKQIKVICFTELPEKADISDWLAAGHSKQELVERIKAAGLWDPPEPEADDASSHDNETMDEPDAVPWPNPMEKEAFHGLAGDVVRMIAPHSEADEAALLMNFIVGFGSMIGRKPWIFAGGVRHGTNLFAVLVGGTSKGRKGTSWGPIEELFKRVDEVWAKEKTPGGLSSGEGLVWCIHDEILRPKRLVKGEIAKEPPEMEVEVPGIDDKRLCVIESELGQTLQVLRREGNTLSPVLRQAWDGRDVLQSLTKATKAKATNAHISVLGHVTKAELTENFSAVEILNGLGNRIMWCCVRRSKLLPNGGRIPENEKEAIVLRIIEAAKFASMGPEVRKDESIEPAWAEAYAVLSDGRPGLWGAATARAEAQVIRLAMIYALLDATDTIKQEHLDAALAVWGYCEDSAAFIWANETGDPAADKIMELLSVGPMSQRDLLRKVRLPAGELGGKLSSLSAAGRIVCEEVSTGGRSKKEWALKQ